MARFAPTVIAQAPRDRRIGSMAAISQAVEGPLLGLAADARSRRDYRDRQELLAEARRDADRDELNMLRRDEFTEDDPESGLAEASTRLPGRAPTATTITPGSAIQRTMQSQDALEQAGLEREADEYVKQLFPDPSQRLLRYTARDGRTYVQDRGRDARRQFLAAKQQERAALGVEQRKTQGQLMMEMLKHRNAVELQQLRNEGSLATANARTAATRSRAGGGSGDSRGSGSVDGVTPTQMRSALGSAQRDIDSMMRRRPKPPRATGDLLRDDENRQRFEDIERPAFAADSASTVDRFRPENNPAMDAAIQTYGLPPKLRPFFGDMEPELPRDHPLFKESERFTTQAAQLLKQGRITPEQYRSLMEEYNAGHMAELEAMRRGGR